MKRFLLIFSVSLACWAQSAGVGQIWTVLGPTTLQNAATANGNGTNMAVGGLSSAIFAVNCSVTCSGGTTVNFEASDATTNWAALTAVQVGTNTIATSIANQASGSVTFWQVPIGAFINIRARISGYSAGTITVSATASASPYDPKVLNSNTFLGATAASTAASGVQKVGVVGNAGATVDSAPRATAPTNIVATGGAAVNAEQTAATNGQAQRIVTDLVGKQITLPYANPENFVMGTTAAITDTTSTSVIASAGGSLRNYLTQCTATNSHATVDTFVKILDGATIIFEAFAVHLGGGFAATFPTPLKGTAATAVNAQMVTTGANVIVSCSGYTGL